MTERPKRDGAEYAVAYGAFLFSGLASLAVVVLSRIPLGAGTSGGIGLLIVLPLYVLSLVAMGAGIVLGIRLRDDRRLAILAGLALAVVANFMLEWLTPPYSDLLPIVYGSVALVSFALWMRHRPG